MNTPLTTKQANEQYECQECRLQGDCGFNCVESTTYSVLCPTCRERVWFGGDLKDAPKEYACPYCQTKQVNQYAK